MGGKDQGWALGTDIGGVGRLRRGYFYSVHIHMGPLGPQLTYVEPPGTPCTLVPVGKLPACAPRGPVNGRTR